ncbi:hypothetical protein HA466_0069130 [Hirschfeldia incana]|nr:hypothetical protein HA466_0069130 [Hirschfeldia incana]
MRFLTHSTHIDHDLSFISSTLSSSRMENGSLFPGYLKAAWWPVFFLRGGSIPEVFGNHKPQTRSKAYGCGQAPPQLTPRK